VGSASPLIMMVLMFVVFWFLLIRPQVKRQKEHQAMLQALKKGDTVITRGGLIGKISGITDNVLTIELQEKVRVRMLRSHLEGKYEGAVAGDKSGQESKAA
jgi:preprotein translocase subunit YajC